jgi:hypothetical protein
VKSEIGVSRGPARKQPLAESALAGLGSAMPRPSLTGISKLAQSPLEAGDELDGAWPRERLIEMDSDFVDAMERAISRRPERRPDGEAPERAA